VRCRVGSDACICSDGRRPREQFNQAICRLPGHPNATRATEILSASSIAERGDRRGTLAFSGQGRCS
jgi:hypothetical protein